MPTQPGAVTQQYVSAQPFLTKREYQDYLVMPQKSKANLALMMMELNMAAEWKPTAQESGSWKYYTHSLPAAMELIDTTGATITNGTTNSITVVMASSALSGFIRENYKVRIGSKTGYIYSVSRTSGVATMVIKTFDSSNFAGLTAGTVIPVVGNAFGEGSNGQTPLKYPIGYIENFIQISKEADEITDVVGKQKLEAPDGLTYTYLSHLLMLERMTAQMSNDIIASQITPAGFDAGSPSLVNNAGEPVQSFRGIDQYAKSFGIPSPLAALGTYATTDFTAFEDAAIAAFNQGKDYLILGSTKSLRPFSFYAKNLTGSAGLQPARINANGRELDMATEKIITPGMFEFTFAPLSIMDDPRGLGVSDIAKNIYGIPRNGIATSSGEVQQRMRLRYIPQYPISGNGNLVSVDGATALKMREIHTGNLSPYPSNGAGKAIWRTDVTAYFSVEIIGPEHLVWQQTVN